MMKLPYRPEPWDPTREVLLSDGAWGTELQRLGLPPGYLADEWCLSNPDRVAQVARAYLEAGARVIETNSFGASRISLDRHGLADKTVEINRRAAELTATAVGGKALTVGSIGPCTRLLAMGEVSEKDLEDAFTEQASALEAGGADWIVVETMFDAREMVIAVRAARSATALPIAASMTYDPPAYRTMMGDKVEDCIWMAQEAGAQVVGTNCGHGVQTFAELVRRMRGYTDLPIWAYANAGVPQVRDGRAVYDESPQDFARQAVELADCGASIIGGCCGTTPAFIREIHAGLERRAAAQGPLAGSRPG